MHIYFKKMTHETWIFYFICECFSKVNLIKFPKYNSQRIQHFYWPILNHIKTQNNIRRSLRLAISSWLPNFFMIIIYIAFKYASSVYILILLFITIVFTLQFKSKSTGAEIIGNSLEESITDSRIQLNGNHTQNFPKQSFSQNFP